MNHSTFKHKGNLEFQSQPRPSTNHYHVFSCSSDVFLQVCWVLFAQKQLAKYHFSA